MTLNLFDTHDRAAGYAAGIIDGEGSIRKSDLLSGRTITVTNTDYGIIVAYIRALDVLGVGYTVNKYLPPAGECDLFMRRKSQWVVRVQKKSDIAALRRVIQLHSVKAERLYADCRIPVARQKRGAAEAVRLYESGLTLSQTAAGVGLSVPTVRRLLVEAGIEIRKKRPRTGNWDEAVP